MTDDAHLETLARLRAAGESFCVATVLRTAEATSAKAGAKAVVRADGTLVGHLGGACLARAVAGAAAEAIATGEVRLLRVGPPGAATDPGLRFHASGCPSGGTVDLLVEPWRPPPWLAVLGTRPVAVAMARQGALLGLRIAVEPGLPDRAAQWQEFGAQGLGGLAPGARDAVVIARQGEGDLDAAAAALETSAGYVALVASRPKAEVLRARLASLGLPAARIAELRAPAGLDLGAVDPVEIAVAIAADLVAWRRALAPAWSSASG